MSCPHSSDWGQPKCYLCHEQRGAAKERARIVTDLRKMAARYRGPGGSCMSRYQDAATCDALADRYENNRHWESK